MRWTDERVETLRKLWLGGGSASEIVNELNCGITRNAVIGKVHRLGLSGRTKAPRQLAPKPPKPARPAAPTRPPLPAVPPLHAFNEHPAEARKGENDIGDQERAAIAQRADAPAPASQNVTIMELRESMCRWPLGDPASPDFRYCGDAAPIGEGPYCKFHARVAYQPAQNRRQARTR